MRPRKPHEIKRISGTLRPGRDNAVNLPVSPSPAGPLVKPEHLRGRESELFDEYAASAPWLDGLQSSLLAVMCKMLAEAERDPSTMTAARLAQTRGLRADLGFVAVAKQAARAHAEAAPTERPKRSDDPAAKYFGHDEEDDENPAAEFFS